MANSIIDGTGGGYRGKVHSNNALKTSAITIAEFDLAAAQGEAFNLNTEDITVSATTGDQALLYVKNNEDRDLELVGWFIGIRDASRSGATSDTNLFKLITNPTGGTIISDASAAVIVNRNLGSSRVFDLEAYKASAGGKTLTGGNQTAVLYQYHTSGRTFGTVSLVLPRGASLGITVNTYGASFAVYTGFTGYLREI